MTETLADAAPLPRGVGSVERLVVPMQRLVVRGMSTTLLLRELAAVLRELWPDRPACIEELCNLLERTVAYTPQGEVLGADQLRW